MPIDTPEQDTPEHETSEPDGGTVVSSEINDSDAPAASATDAAARIRDRIGAGRSATWRRINGDVLATLGFSGCVVAVMAVLVLPLFRPATPPMPANTSTIVQVQLPPSTEPTPPRANVPVPEQTKPAETRPAVDAATKTDPVPASTTPPSPPPPQPKLVRSARRSPALAMRGSAGSVFQSALYDHIGQYETYPEDAVQQHLQGVVLVVFAMDRSGAVLRVWVKKTSGAPILDRAATQSILRAQPLPAIPPQLPDQITVELPISFSTADAALDN